MSRSFEDTLRTIVKEEAEVICRQTIEILDAKLDQIGRLLNERIGVRTESTEHTNYETTSDSHGPPLANNANAMARYSKIFKSMPDLSSSDEHGQGRQSPRSPLPRYKKTADGIMVRTSSIDRQTSIKKKIAAQKSYSKPCLAIRRECLSQALQAYIVSIVEGLEFARSSLPEQLIEAGHMTEEECSSIRTDKSRKDQIRYIISRTKSRSLQDMDDFLGLIGKQIPHVVVKIWEQFESNLKRNDTSIKCKLCLCFENIDVKEVVDKLWSVGAISDSFYRNAINCSKPRGCQEYLWQKLIDICNNKQTVEKQKVFNIIFDCIQRAGKGGSFDFIAMGLKGMLDAEKKLSCHCQSSINFKTQVSERDSNDSSRSLSSCYSPRSSASGERTSRLSDDLYKETDIDDDNQRTYKKVVRQSSIEEDLPDFIVPRQKIYQTKSLDMLDTITEDSGMTFKKSAQTVEFHRPVRVQVDFEGTGISRRTNSARSTNETRTRRYGSVIEADCLLSHSSLV